MKKLFKVLAVILCLTICLKANSKESDKEALITETKEEIILLNIEEISENMGLVSIKAKRFRLTVDYKDGIISTEDEKNITTDNSVFLKQLRINSKSLSKKNKTPKSVLNKYKFNFDKQGVSSKAGFKQVQYTSNDLIIKKASKINFRIDLLDYLEDKQKIKTDDLDTKAIAKISIKGLELSFDSLEIDAKDIAFVKIKDAKKSKMISSEVIIISGKLSSERDLANVIKSKKFRAISEIDKSIQPKITAGDTKKEKVLKIVNMSDQIEIKPIDTKQFEIKIPVILKTKKAMKEKQIASFSAFDSLVIPVIINTKTSDKLDIKITGILRKKVKMTGGIVKNNEQ